MKIINRDSYLEQLKNSIGNGLVKIITGPRRAGKSFLLFNLFKEYLIANGVDSNHILERKLDDLSNARYRNVFEFASYFKQRYHNDGHIHYLLIDEIQFISPIENPYAKGSKLTFYDALNELRKLPKAEIFITGSNSHLLSSDIATEFRGRDYQIRIHPLSFSEYVSAFPENHNYFSLFQDYRRFGGLPGCLSFSNEKDKKNYLQSVFKTAYLKDVIDRYRLREDTAIEEITKVVASSVGSLRNPSKLSNTFKTKENLNISPITIKLYLSYLSDAFLISKAQRYDLKGRSFIGGNVKFYFEDLGLRNAAADFLGEDIAPHLMESVIYNELIRRGYQVDVGVINANETIKGTQTKIQREVDFVCTGFGKKYYIQSAYLIQDEQKKRQEKKSLLSIRDGFQKIIISLDALGIKQDQDGIYHINLFDFLLNSDCLNRL